MTNNEHFTLERNYTRHTIGLRLASGLSSLWHSPWKAAMLLIYLLALSCVLQKLLWSEAALALLLAIAGALLLLFLLGTPPGSRSAQNALRRAGLVNRVGEAPILVSRKRIAGERPLILWDFDAYGLPLSRWEEQQSALQSALNLPIVRITEGRQQNRILLTTAQRSAALPSRLPWDDALLPQEDFELLLGESLLGPVTIDLNKIPHILLGGSTGSGKSVLLKLLLHQAIRKGALVYLADFKGGVDFPGLWRDQCQLVTSREALLDLLDGLLEELELRKTKFRVAGCQNIQQFQHKYPYDSPHLIFACDEVAALLGRSGLSKADKEELGRVQHALELIAQQGRAFGIHLILATQRPDANVLPGQIKNNLDFRVCGRADNVLSQIILDNTSAAERIPKDAQGRFLLRDGTLFQAYLLGN